MFCVCWFGRENFRGFSRRTCPVELVALQFLMVFGAHFAAQGHYTNGFMAGFEVQVHSVHAIDLLSCQRLWARDSNMTRTPIHAIHVYVYMPYAR